MIAKSGNKRVPHRRAPWKTVACAFAIWSSVALADENATVDSAAIAKAFALSSDGYSSDELLLRDDLRDDFLKSLSRIQGHEIDSKTERAALLHLLRLRKSGKLTARATRRGRPIDDSVMPAAEIAARTVMDRHRVTSDTVLADPIYRNELQREAELISPGIDPYAVRKAVLTLRKRRALRPELVLKVADWGRELRTRSLVELRGDLREKAIPKQPGVYLFRAAGGYLYVGEAGNLAARLAEHTTGSDQSSLAEYFAGNNAERISVELHIFPSDSPASKVSVRRAYESELIRSRQPKFNIRP